MADETYTTETIQRRPEYIERLEKALLSGIFGTETDGDLAGGLLQDPTLFQVAPYKLAGQQGRDPETGAIIGLGPETFAAQYVVEDANNDGIPNPSRIKRADSSNKDLGVPPQNRVDKFGSGKRFKSIALNAR